MEEMLQHPTASEEVGDTASTREHPWTTVREMGHVNPKKGKPKVESHEDSFRRTIRESLDELRLP